MPAAAPLAVAAVAAVVAAVAAARELAPAGCLRSSEDWTIRLLRRNR